jgi:hypothetical protein
MDLVIYNTTDGISELVIEKRTQHINPTLLNAVAPVILLSSLTDRERPPSRLCPNVYVAT